MESALNLTSPRESIESNLTIRSKNDTSELPIYHGYNTENIISAVLSFILTCIVVIGNGMVMLAYKFNYKLQTVTNMCFVSLAFSDFLVGLISIPLWIHYSFKGISDRNLYLFYISFDIFNGTASIFQLTAISIERCFSIVAPVRHRSLSVLSYYAMIFSVWFLAIVSTLLRLLPQKKVTGGDWYNIYTLLVCFVLPVFIMITSYTLLFRTAVKRKDLSFRSTKNQQVTWSSQKKTIKTLLIVTGLFVVAWAPFFVYIALVRYLPSALPSNLEDRTRLWRFVKWMHYINSSLNPFVYSCRNKEFNISFKVLFWALVKCKSFKEVNRQFKRHVRCSTLTARSSFRDFNEHRGMRQNYNEEDIELDTNEPEQTQAIIIDSNANTK
ncbi:octopamine receptor 1-like isoform X2 [Xenia sp. Carnegie-2017]|nr:octopamine receptor 1-like isoform X2 [Xenia sp. Carnegie-2017]